MIDSTRYEVIENSSKVGRCWLLNIVGGGWESTVLCFFPRRVVVAASSHMQVSTRLGVHLTSFNI